MTVTFLVFSMNRFVVVLNGSDSMSTQAFDAYYIGKQHVLGSAVAQW